MTRLEGKRSLCRRASPTADRAFECIASAGTNLAFLLNLLGALPAANWTYVALPKWAIALGITIVNLAAALLACLLPETCGRNLSEDDGEEGAEKAGAEAAGG